MELQFYKCVKYWFSFSISCQVSLLTLSWKKHLALGRSAGIFPLKFSDVWEYVDIRLLQWLLSIIGQNQWQFAFVDVTWQQASKHINKSIICAKANIYWSECLVVSGVKGSGRKILKFLIQALLDVALFQLVEGDFPKENIGYTLRVEQWYYNGILIKNNGNFCFHFQSLNTYFQIQKLFLKFLIVIWQKALSYV